MVKQLSATDFQLSAFPGTEGIFQSANAKLSRVIYLRSVANYLYVYFYFT